MMDTGAYTDTMFGIFHLLGYQFSARLADIGGSRFWRVDQKANYGALDALAAQRINTTLIAEHWEDLLRLAGSLKLGAAQALGLIRTLQTKDRPIKLARALGELGRLVKTLYLLSFAARGTTCATMSPDCPPLGFDQIKMLGRYAFTLPDRVARGELRALRDSTLASDVEG
jgi:TnpA family transposase